MARPRARIIRLAWTLWHWALVAGAIFYGASLQAQAVDSEHLFQEAMAAQQKGENAVAVSDFRALLRQHPEATGVRVNLGAVLAHQKHFAEAITQYRLVLASDPTNRMARVNLAIASQGIGDLSGALRQLQQLHREDAHDAQTTMLLADCLGQLGHHPEAVSLLAPLATQQADNLDLEFLLGSSMIHAGDLQGGVVRVEKAAVQGNSADAYLLAGQTRLAMNQFDLARRDAEAAEHLNGALAGLPTLLGMVSEQQGDYDGAVAALRRALTVDAKDFNAHFYLGGIYYFQRKMPEARQHLTRALQLQPASVQARYELALVARAEGQLDAALKDLQIVVREAPNWLQPHVEIAALYYRLHRLEDGARERRLVDRMLAAQQQSQAQAAH